MQSQLNGVGRTAVTSVQVGGPLGAYLPADQWDIELDYEAFTHIPNESTKVVHHLNEALDWLE